MSQPRQNSERRLLRTNVRWLIRLRWMAAITAVAGSAADLLFLNWYEHSRQTLYVGVAIFIYNAVFRALAGRRPLRLLSLPGVTYAQIVADLACLTLLTMWTGGTASPLLGFYVFHMVIASLLLSPNMAYLTAGAGFAMMLAGLHFSNQWPVGRSFAEDRTAILSLTGWSLTLLLTVFLTNHITANLRRRRADLIQRNRRIRQLADDLRAQQQKMIQQEKMVAMGEMAAGVAHEVSNPLASMDGVLQLMQRNQSRLTPENVGKLREQVHRISQIVKQLTRFARPADDKWQQVPVNKLVNAALDMARFDHRLRNVQTELDLDTNNCPVNVQSQAMEQVLLNLVINATDAMVDTPRPLLKLRTECRSDQCTITVQDNGHGIAPEHLEHIFEPFYTTKPVGKGTGLGLAISYNLVRTHGGRIDAHSAPETGTRMVISLPRSGAKPLPHSGSAGHATKSV